MAEFPWWIRVSWRIQKVVAPALRSSQSRFYEAVLSFLNGRPVWLDVGGGRDLVPRWLPPKELARIMAAAARAKAIIAIDYDAESLRDNNLERRVRGDVAVLPFASASFDLITANMVVEHLSEPEAALREIARVLKPSGAFVFHTSNVVSPIVALSALIPSGLKKWLIYFFEGRKEQDVFPTFYTLNTVGRIRRHAANCGLTVRSVATVWTSPATQRFGPLVVFELLFIRLCGNALPFLRPNIVAVLQRPEE